MAAPEGGVLTGALADARAVAVVAAYRTGAILASTLPDPVANTAAAALGRTLRRAMGGRRRMLQRHMRRALGPEASPLQVRRAVDAAFDAYARYWVETFRLASYDAAHLDRVFHVEGWEHFTKAHEAGRGVILALPHVGQWEVAGTWLVHQGHPPTAVAERLEPERLYEWFVELRERKLGFRIVALDDPAAGRVLIGTLREGGVVTLLADRDLSGSGPEVEFFGERTRLPAGPARLALQTGAAVIPAAVYEEQRWRYLAVLRPPLAVPEVGSKGERAQALTQELAYELEGLIRRAPSQWHLLQPNWPSDVAALQRWRSQGLLA